MSKNTSCNNTALPRNLINPFLDAGIGQFVATSALSDLTSP